MIEQYSLSLNCLSLKKVSRKTFPIKMLMISIEKKSQLLLVGDKLNDQMT